MKLLLCFLLTFMYYNLNAQNIEWARHIAGKGTSTPTNLEPGESLSKAITVDDKNNVFVVGYFNDSVRFDSSNNNFTVGTKGEIFIAKYDSLGQFIWVKILKGNGGNRINGIKVDKENNLLIIGTCSSSTDFDPSTNTSILQRSSEESNFSFIAKFNNEGQFIWVQKISSIYFATFTEGLDLAKDNAIYVLGKFYNQINFYTEIDTINLQGFKTSTFIAKYNSMGDFQFAKAIFGNDLVEGKAIEVGASGNIYIAGYFSGTVDFNPDLDTLNVTAVGFSYHPNRFFAKYDSIMDLKWIQSFNVNRAGSNSTGSGIVLALDKAENLILSGDFYQDVDFNTGIGISLLSSPSTTSIFLCKYDSSGLFVWVKGIFGGFCSPSGIDTDCKDEIYLTGSFVQADFDPSVAVFELNTIDMNAFANFFAKYSTEGNFIWANRIGNNGYGSGIIFSTIFVKNDKQYTAGGFKQSGDFDPSENDFILTASGVGHNAFFAKYSAPNIIMIGNDTVFCGGMVSLTLEANKADATYLWSTQSTDSSIFVSDPGLYWVNVTFENCTYTDYIKVSEMDCAEIEMPNIFSPNQDGLNDYFIPLKLEYISEAEMIIFNRWGNVIYKNNNIPLTWNGKSNGVVCSEGIYFWTILYKNYKNDRKTLSGNLMLIK